ncbi:hypothetical protein PCCS19_50780 [Paenibacillus sp. CCS19]|nr:hypothetical protein PCCS19_50780 [Paenibacillus cellulosilyticus]
MELKSNGTKLNSVSSPCPAAVELILITGFTLMVGLTVLVLVFVATGLEVLASVGLVAMLVTGIDE